MPVDTDTRGLDRVDPGPEAESGHGRIWLTPITAFSTDGGVLLVDDLHIMTASTMGRLAGAFVGSSGQVKYHPSFNRL